MTSAVVFRKHPVSAVSLREEFKTSWCSELLILTTSLIESIRYELLELRREKSQANELPNALKQNMFLSSFFTITDLREVG